MFYILSLIFASFCNLFFLSWTPAICIHSVKYLRPQALAFFSASSSAAEAGAASSKYFPVGVRCKKCECLKLAKRRVSDHYEGPQLPRCPPSGLSSACLVASGLPSGLSSGFNPALMPPQWPLGCVYA